MTRLLFIIALCIVSFNNLWGQHQPSIEELFLKADGLYDEVDNMKYFYRLSTQFGIQPDTAHSHGNGNIEKVMTGSMGIKYNITDLSQDIEMIYSEKKFAWIYHKSKSFRELDFDENTFYKDFASRINKSQIPSVFKKDFFSNILKDTSVQAISFVNDTIIDGSICFQVQVKFVPESRYNTETIHYFFQKDNFFCKGHQTFGTYAGVPRHSSFIVVFADINLPLNQDQFIPDKNIPIKYKDLTKQRRPKSKSFIKAGKKVPKFKGYTLNDTKVTHEDLKDQITVIDFWYIGCGPCVAIVPTLDSIARKYKDVGVFVYGMNPYDSPENILRFKKYGDLAYDAVTIEHRIVDKFKISAYPTFYIIDQEGKVAFSKRGGDENLLTILSEEIEKLLSP
ncbi:MAG: TlpA disulfide reductase family protein [Bacteroidota bacterium]